MQQDNQKYAEGSKMNGFRITLDLEADISSALESLRRETGLRSHGTLIKHLLREILINATNNEVNAGRAITSDKQEGA